MKNKNETNLVTEIIIKLKKQLNIYRIATIILGIITAILFIILFYK